VSRAFGKANIEEVEILVDDFCKILAGEGKVARMAAKLDALVNERIKKHKRAQSKVKESQTDKGPVSKVRRNAIVYIEPQYGIKNSNDIHNRHSKAICKMLELIPSIEYSKKLNSEIYSIRKIILKRQIIADIIKYSEYLENASDIKKGNVKETDKFLTKVKRSSEDLKGKYGEKVYYLIEYVIRQVIRYPIKKERIDKEYADILSTAIALIMKRDKSSLYDPNAFPRPIMIFHEVYCYNFL
jgi:hypothetical protein